MLRNERGISLPLILIIMFVLSLLGTAIWQYSVTDTIQVVRAEKRMQAHYLARSGADAVAEYMIRNPSQAMSIINMTNQNNKATGSLGSGKDFQLYASGDTVNGITITAMGTTGGVSQTVHLDLSSKSASQIFTRAIYTYGDLDISKMKKIEGDVASAGSIKANESYYESYTAAPNTYEHHPSPIIPSLSAAESINVGNHQTVTINGNGHYSSITMSSHGRLRFNVGNSIMKVVVDDLVTKGNVIVDVSGSGRLELYITNSADIQTPLVVNSGDPSNLFIFLKDGSYLNMQANGVTNGYIYGPKATVGITSGHSTINGAIIANLFIKKHNNAQPSIGNVVFYAVDPNKVVALDAIINLSRGLWRD